MQHCSRDRDGFWCRTLTVAAIIETASVVMVTGDDVLEGFRLSSYDMGSVQSGRVVFNQKRAYRSYKYYLMFHIYCMTLRVA